MARLFTELIEQYTPGLSDEDSLKRSLELGKDYIKTIKLRQLQPPIHVRLPISLLNASRSLISSSFY